MPASLRLSSCWQSLRPHVRAYGCFALKPRPQMGHVPWIIFSLLRAQQGQAIARLQFSRGNIAATHINLVVGCAGEATGGVRDTQQLPLAPLANGPHNPALYDPSSAIRQHRVAPPQFLYWDSTHGGGYQGVTREALIHDRELNHLWHSTPYELRQRVGRRVRDRLVRKLAAPQLVEWLAALNLQVFLHHASAA